MSRKRKRHAQHSQPPSTAVTAATDIAKNQLTFALPETSEASSNDDVAAGLAAQPALEQITAPVEEAKPVERAQFGELGEGREQRLDYTAAPMRVGVAAATSTVAASPTAAASHVPVTLVGQRLRAAREKAGRTVEDLSKQLRIAPGLIADIESDRIAESVPAVYARSYLRAYARAVGLPESLAESVVPTETIVPELVSVKPMRRAGLLSKLGNNMLYIALTLLIAGPVFWGALEASRFQTQAPARLTPLDVAASPGATPSSGPSPVPLETPKSSLPEARDPAPAAAVAPTTASLAGPVAGPVAKPAMPAAELTPADEPHRPVAASMAPVPHGDGGHHVTLSLNQQSWVEIRGADNQRIEYAMLPAGTVRSYQIAGRAELLIGNARNAQITVDDKSVDLAPFVQGNVAKLELSDALR